MAKQTPTSSEIAETIFESSSAGMPLELADIIHKYIDEPFIFTAEVDDYVYIPVIKSANGICIDWGDGNTEFFEHDQLVTHTFGNAGRFTIQVYGEITKISFQDVTELVEVSQWGDLRLETARGMFDGCSNFTLTARDTLDVSRIQDFSRMFSGCASFDGAGLENWDVSRATTMRYMFHGCQLLTADLSNWDVRHVSNMEGMFNGCRLLSADLGAWKVANGTVIVNMFHACDAINTDFRNWNIGNIAPAFGPFARNLPTSFNR